VPAACFPLLDGQNGGEGGYYAGPPKKELGALGKAATPFSKALQRECILPPITTRAATMTRCFAGFINENERTYTVS